MPDFRLSHSSIEDYRTCPQKWRLGRKEKVTRAPGWSLIGGNAVHTVTAVLDLRDFGVPSDEPDNFADAFDAEIRKQVEATGVPTSEWHRAGRASKDKPNKEDEKWWRANGPQYVENWRDWLNASPYSIWITPDGEPAVELALELSEADGFAGTEFRGYIDRVLERDQSLGVVDLKTGARVPGSAMQPGTYRLALGKVLGWEHAPSWGAFFMNREGVLTEPTPLWQDYPLERIEHEYAEVRRGIENEVFTPRPGPLCGSCGVNAYCYEWGGAKAAEFRPW